MHCRTPTLASFSLLVLAAVAVADAPSPPSPRSQTRAATHAIPEAPTGLHTYLIEQRESGRARPVQVRALLGSAEWVPTTLVGWSAVEALSPGPMAVVRWTLVVPADGLTPPPSEALVAVALDRAQGRAQDTVSTALEAGSLWSLDQPIATLRGQLAAPVDAPIAVPFGPERLTTSPTAVRHPGLTYRTVRPMSVRAAARGIVRFAEVLEGYGGVVILDHGVGYHTVYANLSGIAAVVGEMVEARQDLGRVGDARDRAGFYFELRHLGDPLDPTEWLSP